MNKRRITIMILAAIALLGGVSFISMLLYFDPYTAPRLAVSLLIVSFLLWCSSFMSLILYFFKKIYYRGEVYMYHIVASVRQSFLLALWGLGCITFFAYQIPLILSWFLLFSVILLVELFIQNL